MGIITTQKIVSFYDRFKDIDITFTKEVIQVTGLVTQEVYLKCGGDFWPCIIYSTSFQGAKVIANVKSNLTAKLEEVNNSVSLRFCFKSPEGNNPVAFFVASRSMGYAPYGKATDAAIFTLQFTQRPPDDLIMIMGRILEANFNFAKRKEDRIIINLDSQRKMRILPKECAIFIEGVPRHCILRDVSFSGAKVIMMGVAKFLVNKDIALRVDFDEPRESFLIRGRFVRSEMVEGRKDLVALGIQFTESLVPMGYKIRTNEYLGLVHLEVSPPMDPNAN
ncbi:MAG: PilZ domain-containing protein [Treponema sp.]|jgi:hypothetical protein|nr:PilZ domain-containing protein [Treponema sp.]